MATGVDVEDLSTIKICIDNNEVISEIEDGELTSEDEEIVKPIAKPLKKSFRKESEIKRDLASPIPSDEEQPLAAGLEDLESFGVAKVGFKFRFLILIVANLMVLSFVFS